MWREAALFLSRSLFQGLNKGNAMPVWVLRVAFPYFFA